MRISSIITSNKNHNTLSPKTHYGLKMQKFQQTLGVQSDIFVKSKTINNIPFKGTNKEIKLGSHYNKERDSIEFGVFSHNATHIKLYLFDEPVHKEPIHEIDMIKGDADKWYAEIKQDELAKLNLKIGDKNRPIYYGYRAWGPNWEYDKNWTPGSDVGFKSHVDCNGNRFNPNKLLTDPYAREISHDPISPKKQGVLIDSEIYVTGDKNYLRDSGLVAPKSIFLPDDKSADFGEKPLRKFADDIIYEVHVKGFTKKNLDISNEYKGKYKGAAMMAKYLKDLGVTMVELLPVQEFQSDANTGSKNGNNMDNYWGYMTNQFFAPDSSYSSDQTPGGPTKEFKEMVKAFHDNGIKVCMDVVYNHTGEGGLWNNDPNKTNLYSLRGLDSSYYYEPSSDKRYFYDSTGCGANFNIAQDGARDLVIDSIKYWSEEMGIDAFRFDLAPVLGNSRKENGFEFDPKQPDGFFERLKKAIGIRSGENKKGVDLIAEPWIATEPWGLQGQFPKDWWEWNDKFRDTINKMNNDPKNLTPGEIADVVSGSQKRYGGDSTRSVNFVACHDGQTLNDRVYGKEKALNLIKNSILLTMVSKGTPMLLGGDEMIRTQNMIGNAYNQDNDISYFDWSLDDNQRKIKDFTKGAIHFRKNHRALCSTSYFKGIDSNGNGLADIEWIREDGSKIEYGDTTVWDNSKLDFLGFRIDESEVDDKHHSLYVATNKGNNSIPITLPHNLPGKRWYQVTCTDDLEGGFKDDDCAIPIDNNHVYMMPSQTVALFIEK